MDFYYFDCLPMQSSVTLVIFLCLSLPAVQNKGNIPFLASSLEKMNKSFLTSKTTELISAK